MIWASPAMADAVRALLDSDMVTIKDGVKLASPGVPHSNNLED
jgi:hypothetical protein